MYEAFSFHWPTKPSAILLPLGAGNMMKWKRLSKAGRVRVISTCLALFLGSFSSIFRLMNVDKQFHHFIKFLCWLL